MRITPVCCASVCVAAALGGGSALAQNYDRILTADDITYSPAPDGGGVGGGWLVRATVWLANESPAALDLGCQVTLWINGVQVSSAAQSVMVSNVGTGGSGCGSTCVTDGWCAACKQSIIVPGTCYCCNHSVSTEFVVPSLSPGDVITAGAAALPGAAPELATSNDAAVKVVPVPGGYNRKVKPSDVHYGRTAEGTYAIAGEVELPTSYDGERRDLSYDALVFVNGVPVHGPGTCTGTTRLISITTGTFIASNPPSFLCDQACAYCMYGGGAPSGNTCIPPLGSGPSGNPYCQCWDGCGTARIVPGMGWQLDIPQLGPTDAVTVIVHAHPGSLPELDETDDAVSVQVADAAVCKATLADVGRQGGLPRGDGLFDNNDFIAFIGFFFDTDPRADLGGPGGLFGPDTLYDNNDFIVFIDLFFTGC